MNCAISRNVNDVRRIAESIFRSLIVVDFAETKFLEGQDKRSSDTVGAGNVKIKLILSKTDRRGDLTLFTNFLAFQLASDHLDSRLEINWNREKTKITTKINKKSKVIDGIQRKFHDSRKIFAFLFTNVDRVTLMSIYLLFLSTLTPCNSS